jgi:hypothetical protein
MESMYKLTAYNAEAIYVFGTESEARDYLESLNADREVNHYEYESLSDSEVTEDIEAIAFNLSDYFAENGN